MFHVEHATIRGPGCLSSNWLTTAGALPAFPRIAESWDQPCAAWRDGADHVLESQAFAHVVIIALTYCGAVSEWVCQGVLSWDSSE